MSYNFYDGYKAKKFDVIENFYLGGKQAYATGDKVLKVKTVKIAHDTDGLDEGVELLTLPAGGVLLDMTVRTTEVWNSETSDLLDIGYGNDLDEFYADEDLQAVGIKSQEAGTIPPAISDDATTIKAKVTSVDAAEELNQGELEVVMLYTI